MLLALLWVVTPVSAQDSSLYEQGVAVQDDSEQSLLSARKEAMAAVLVKVSGERGVTANAAVAEALRHAEDYVARYGFRRGDDGQLQLWAAFEQNAINDLLTSAGLAKWRGARPDTLVWLVTQGPDGLVVDGVEGDTAALLALRGQAAERGLPLVTPLLDLQDQRALSAEQLWSNDADAIRSASARYAAPVILVGRVRSGSAGWSGQWTVYQGSERRDWQNRAASSEELVQAAMDWQADGLAAVYVGAGAGIAAGGGAATLGEVLTVGGLQSFGDYLRVSQYFERSSQVTAVRLTQMRADTAEFTLDLAGSPDALRRVLTLEGVLVPTMAAGTGGDGADYRLSR